jgi:hypothetical protein
VSRKIKSVICLSADLSCFLVFLTADLIFADLAFFLFLCPGKIKSVICLSAHLSFFFWRDPREITLLTKGRLAQGRKVDLLVAEEVTSSFAASQSWSRNAVEGVEAEGIL